MNHLDNLVKIYWEAVHAVDPKKLIAARVKKKGGTLVIDYPEGAIFEDLSR